MGSEATRGCAAWVLAVIGLSLIALLLVFNSAGWIRLDTDVDEMHKALDLVPIDIDADRPIERRSDSAGLFCGRCDEPTAVKRFTPTDPMFDCADLIAAFEEWLGAAATNESRRLEEPECVAFGRPVGRPAGWSAGASLRVGIGGRLLVALSLRHPA